MNQFTILLVEDHEAIRNALRVSLQRAGYTILEAGDGEEGVRQARYHRPALILLDIDLPLLNGWEAAEQIKNEPATAATHIIALTAHDLNGQRGRLEEVGFCGYLHKPVTVRRVLDEVERCFGSGGPHVRRSATAA